MTESDYPEFVTTLAALGEVFGKEVSTAMLEIYWAVLKKLSMEDFRSATSVYMEIGKFYPKPADLLEIVVPDVKSRAALAFDKLLSSLSSVGTYCSVTFDDPAIHLTVEAMGGWVEMGMKDPTDQWFRKDFEKYYSVYARRVQAEGVAGVPVCLAGRTDLGRARSGHEQTDAKLIGDTKVIACWTRQAVALGSRKRDEISYQETLKLIGENNGKRNG